MVAKKKIDEVASMLMRFENFNNIIFVRDQNDLGQWKSFSLAELPQKKRANHQARMIVERLEKL